MKILERLRAGGTQVAFDSNYRPVGWPRINDARKWMNEAFRRCDIALPTLDDEQRLFGDADADACLARLRGLGPREIVLKLGGEGNVVWSAGAAGITSIAPTKVSNVVDTTAAGDSFNAGYLYGRIVGKEPVAASTIGGRLAAIKIQHPGAIMPRAAMPKLDTI